jgi:lipopolysaccharide/colanic/teichoic acid biosynthesis glycosyltransferase
VSGRSELKNFEDWIKLDLEYIDDWSLWLDIKIIFKTIPVMLFGTGK